MPARSARLSTVARRWLLREVAYLAERSPAAAERLLQRIAKVRRSLADYPGIASPGIIAGTRRLIVAPYVLTIRVRGGDLEIVAIRHGRQSDAHAPRDLDHPDRGSEAEPDEDA